VFIFYEQLLSKLAEICPELPRRIKNMKRPSMYLPLAAAAFLLASACGLLREPEAARSPIEAIPVEVKTSAPGAGDSRAVPETLEPAAATASPDLTESQTEPQSEADLRIYTISQADSQARFELDEDLRGERKTVVGITDQVAGEIALDLNDLSKTQVGVILINARTLLTDNNLRNRAIQNEILDTGDFEFITFTPRAIAGLPASVAIGEEVSFTIEGDLTIRDITRPVLFNVAARAVSEEEFSGTASAVIHRADFDLNIPSVPNVANVEEEVELYIEFVAKVA
jgi:polyisoprenoid-binding protein YceI